MVRKLLQNAFIEVGIKRVSCHPHFAPLARISLTLSHHFSLSFIASGRSSGLHPVSSHICWMYVQDGHTAFARPYVGVHRNTSPGGEKEVDFTWSQTSRRHLYLIILIRNTHVCWFLGLNMTGVRIPTDWLIDPKPISLEIELSRARPLILHDTR